MFTFTLTLTDPKMDILNLRSKSAKYGYMDPNFAGGLDFGVSFW